ncbi:alginate O-acetyltransferase AlgX-related protein [Bordetella genomosp. 1]|nr:cell division protein FtsQ [Bordetella genomosp. 1]
MSVQEPNASGAETAPGMAAGKLAAKAGGPGIKKAGGAPAPSGPEPSHRLTAFVVAGLLAVGGVSGIWMLAHANVSRDQLAPSAWLDGHAGNALNAALRLPIQAELDTTTAAARYRLLGDLGPQVALGCPDWLFYRDGLRPQPGVRGAFEDRIKLMQHWVDRLRQQGVQVLVVPVPDKSRIQSDGLCGLPYAESMRQRLDAWQQALGSYRVPYVDLRPALAKGDAPRFFHTDVHMTAVGAQAAANAVADAALPLLGGRGPQTFKVDPPGAPEPRMGDLIVLAGLEHAPAAWRPPLDQEPKQTIAPVRGGGLLDDTPPVEVLLAGSSNGLRSLFAERLGDRLGREVWNLSMDGGQFSGALLGAFKQQQKWPKSLKLVIWEFSEMALSLPLTPEERTALAALK